jgi:cell division protein FtsB
MFDSEIFMIAVIAVILCMIVYQCYILIAGCCKKRMDIEKNQQLNALPEQKEALKAELASLKEDIQNKG